MRNHCDQEELEAHNILDQVKAGATVSQAAINRALFVLGDGIGLVKLGVPKCNHIKNA
jgi:DNA recombination-dependent growth factor C